VASVSGVGVYVANLQRLRSCGVYATCFSACLLEDVRAISVCLWRALPFSYVLPT
jgi:hypothetical protein